MEWISIPKRAKHRCINTNSISSVDNNKFK